MFRNRHDAGYALAKKLIKYKDQKNIVLLGLARGGVVVAYEVARELSLPLNVIVPRKIGAPGNPELALGSIMENGESILNESIIKMLGVTQAYIDKEIEKERAKAQERLQLYRKVAPVPEVKGHTVILVDDGIATGSTMLTAIQSMLHLNAKKVVVAVPVASTEALRLVEKAAHEVVCLYSRYDFVGVGLYYEDFDQTEDVEVVRLLEEAKKRIGDT
jgi:putative phosphoribosyl transferase